MTTLSRGVLTGALTLVVLAVLDLVGGATFYGGLLATAGQSIVFFVLALGALATLLLPVALLWAFLDRLLPDEPRLRLPIAAGALAALTLLLNLSLGREQWLFQVVLVVLAGLYGLGLAWLDQKENPLWAALPALAALVIFGLDATQLRGLYTYQHVTLSVYAAVSLFVAWRVALQLQHGRREPGTIGSIGAALPAVLAAVIFWVAPADAVSESLRVALTRGATVTQSAIELVTPLTDLDGDGFGVILGRGDCEPFDPESHPGAPEVIGDGLDQNCLAGDPSTETAARFSQWQAERGQLILEPVDGVVLVTIDALRADRVFGPKANPQLADLAGESIAFRRAYCAYPGTIPSLYAFATSDYPFAMEFTPYRNFEFPAKDDRRTLFEILGTVGVEQFAALYHVVLSPRFGVTRGLPEVWAPSSSAEGISSAATTDQGLAFLQRERNGPFFLWLHYFDPHAPYETGSGEPSGGSAEARYDVEVDRAVSQILRFLHEGAAHLDNVAVIIAADHGEEFGDHGATHHGQALYDESVRGPLLFLLPSGETGTVVHPVSLVDLAPTILELLGHRTAIPGDWRGRSLVPSLAGELPTRPFPVFIEAFRPGRAQQLFGVVSGEHKLIYRLESEVFELYHLTDDAREQRNIIESTAGRDQGDLLKALLDVHLAVNR